MYCCKLAPLFLLRKQRNARHKYMQSGKILLNHALNLLEKARLSMSDWRLGGGTVLMLRYQHRLSNDIDIFFPDSQFLPYISPRLNDAIDDIEHAYEETPKYTRLVFEEGKIHFIVAQPVSQAPPIIGEFHDGVHCDVSSEIIGKKIYYRGENFTTRDIFDLAEVTAKSPKTEKRSPQPVEIAEHTSRKKAHFRIFAVRS